MREEPQGRKRERSNGSETHREEGKERRRGSNSRCPLGRFVFVRGTRRECMRSKDKKEEEEKRALWARSCESTPSLAWKSAPVGSERLMGRRKTIFISLCVFLSQSLRVHASSNGERL